MDPAALARQRRAQLVWDEVAAQLAREHCRFRLYRHGRSAYLWCRDTRSQARFSLAPLKADRSADIRLALQQCQQASAQGFWSQAERAGDSPEGRLSWRQLAEQVAQRVIETIPKEGSRVHLLADLRLRIARLDGTPTAEALEAWAAEVDPATSRRSFDRRLEVLSQISRCGMLDLSGALARLRQRRPRGAAVRLQRAQRQRVRVVPSDAQILAWLQSLDGLDQWVFAVLATWGLRPHELWHVGPPDAQGWLTIPGDMQTKSARTHFAPPVPKAWLQQLELERCWTARSAELRRRWPIRWRQEGGIAIPVNNHALGQYIYKQLALRGVRRLTAPLADGDGEDWCRPYDLRHAYAIRCAVSAETRGVWPERQAEWLGHSWEVHQRIYLRWLPPSWQRQAMQRDLGGQA